MLRLQHAVGGGADDPGIVTGHEFISCYSVLCYKVDNQKPGYQMLKKKRQSKMRNMTQNL